MKQKTFSSRELVQKFWVFEKKVCLEGKVLLRLSHFWGNAVSVVKISPTSKFCKSLPAYAKTLNWKRLFVAHKVREVIIEVCGLKVTKLRVLGFGQPKKVTKLSTTGFFSIKNSKRPRILEVLNVFGLAGRERVKFKGFKASSSETWKRTQKRIISFSHTCCLSALWDAIHSTTKLILFRYQFNL